MCRSIPCGRSWWRQAYRRGSWRCAWSLRRPCGTATLRWSRTRFRPSPGSQRGHLTPLPVSMRRCSGAPDESRFDTGDQERYDTMDLDRAQESLRAAELCLQVGYANSAASRAYYAMFQAAQVALEHVGSRRAMWSHAGLQAAFATECIHRRKIYPAALREHLS